MPDEWGSFICKQRVKIYKCIQKYCRSKNVKVTNKHGIRPKVVCLDCGTEHFSKTF